MTFFICSFILGCSNVLSENFYLTQFAWIDNPSALVYDRKRDQNFDFPLDQMIYRIRLPLFLNESSRSLPLLDSCKYDQFLCFDSEWTLCVCLVFALITRTRVPLCGPADDDLGCVKDDKKYHRRSVVVGKCLSLVRSKMRFQVMIIAVIVANTLVAVVQAQIPWFGGCAEYQPMAGFSRDKFMGTWYEQERYFTFSEVAGRCVSATYERRVDGKLYVNNVITNRL